LSLAASAATRVVPDQFPIIQDAINAAGNGDTIQFNSLVVGNFTVSGGKQLTFTGVGSWGGTMTVNGGSNVTINGMDIAGGPVSTDPGQIQLGQYCQGQTPVGIDATNAVVNITNSSFSCFETAISAVQTNVTVDGGEFQYNYFGGAIFQQGGDLHIQSSDFSFNSGLQGGAIHAESDTAEIVTSRFYANAVSLGEGGGVYVAADTAHIEHNDFDNNFNLIWWINGVTINDPTQLLGNVNAGDVIGVGDGAGLYVANPALAPASDVYVHDNTFCGNMADRGGGAFIDDVAGVRLANNRFADNWTMHEGGGLLITASEPFDAASQDHVLNNTFLTNTAGLIPPPFPTLTTEIGAGGAVGLLGTVVDFRNNIVANTNFGGGVMARTGPTTRSATSSRSTTTSSTGTATPSGAPRPTRPRGSTSRAT